MAYATRHTKPLMLKATRQEEIYAVDMYGTSPWSGADPTLGQIGQSIKWRYDPDTRQGVCADYKVPEDRVLGTPIKAYFVYSMTGGPGGDLIEWVITYVFVEMGGDVTGTAIVRSVNDTTNGTDILSITEPIEFAASIFDGRRTPMQLQLTFDRWADDAQNDTDPNYSDLYKIIMEYTAYV
jgi:hypothetical protein